MDKLCKKCGQCYLIFENGCPCCVRKDLYEFALNRVVGGTGTEKERKMAARLLFGARALDWDQEKVERKLKGKLDTQENLNHEVTELLKSDGFFKEK